MSTTQWILVTWIALSGLIVFARGFAGSVREYTVADAIFGLIECGLAAYLVTTL